MCRAKHNGGRRCDQHRSYQAVSNSRRKVQRGENNLANLVKAEEEGEAVTDKKRKVEEKLANDVKTHEEDVANYYREVYGMEEDDTLGDEDRVTPAEEPETTVQTEDAPSTEPAEEKPEEKPETLPTKKEVPAKRKTESTSPVIVEDPEEDTAADSLDDVDEPAEDGEGFEDPGVDESQSFEEWAKKEGFGHIADEETQDAEPVPSSNPLFDDDDDSDEDLGYGDDTQGWG